MIVYSNTCNTSKTITTNQTCYTTHPTTQMNAFCNICVSMHAYTDLGSCVHEVSAFFHFSDLSFFCSLLSS